MATREEIGLALDVIRLINRMGQALRISAKAVSIDQSPRIQAIVDNPTNSAKLVSGLTALGVAVGELQTDKNLIVAAADDILSGIPEIVKL